ncbi:amidohydrolase family protein [Halalkalibacter okhensis]|uniref:Cytosine deaminase n=1 Tax=Halalkalibacter okhensis TaxID=333138 RepID=A0A0B0IMA7_9BACI|nr:amidohydrolase family protein [Halalkalibacter okhensis]KHF41209.1 cytosine deaminase [Halalkalibacter okhensis]
MYDLVVKNVKIDKKGTVDIGIKEGVIKRIGKVNEPGSREIEGMNLLALPPYVESHLHLDTALTNGRPYRNQSGELFEGIQVWNQYREQYLTHEDVIKRALEVIEIMSSQGVLYMRSMVDISDPSFTALKALLEVKEKVASFIDLQLIAFPQNGLVSSTEGEQQLKRAIELGVDGISAVPHLEATREKGFKSLELCFQLALQYDQFVHIFCDEIDDSQSRFLEVVTSLAMESSLNERVSVSHVNAMAYYEEAYVRKIIGQIKASNINVVTAPLINCAMQGRFDSWPKGRGITRVKELHESGVNVAVAHDDFLSPFYPLGTGSLLAAGHMLVHLAHMTGAEDFDAVIKMLTSNAAKVLGVNQYGIAEGNEANFILIRAKNAQDLIRRQPVAEFVFSKGRIIAETPPQKTKWSAMDLVDGMPVQNK